MSDGKPIDLDKREYRVKINGNAVSFSIYGEEDDLNTLELFITFLLESMVDSSLGDDEDGPFFGDDDE
jgi:hypothetical protein